LKSQKRFRPMPLISIRGRLWLDQDFWMSERSGWGNTSGKVCREYLKKQGYVSTEPFVPGAGASIVEIMRDE